MRRNLILWGMQGRKQLRCFQSSWRLSQNYGFLVGFLNYENPIEINKHSPLLFARFFALVCLLCWIVISIVSVLVLVAPSFRDTLIQDRGLLQYLSIILLIMTTTTNKCNQKNILIGVKFFEDDSLARVSKADKVGYLKEQGLSTEQINTAFERYQKKRQLLLMHERGLQQVASSQKVYDQEIKQRLEQMAVRKQAKK